MGVCRHQREYTTADCVTRRAWKIEMPLVTLRHVKGVIVGRGLCVHWQRRAGRRQQRCVE